MPVLGLLQLGHLLVCRGTIFSMRLRQVMPPRVRLRSAAGPGRMGRPGATTGLRHLGRPSTCLVSVSTTRLLSWCKNPPLLDYFETYSSNKHTFAAKTSDHKADDEADKRQDDENYDEGAEEIAASWIHGSFWTESTSSYYVQNIMVNTWAGPKVWG